MTEIKVKPKKERSVLICTPCYGGMCTVHYVQGVLHTMEKMRSLGVRTGWAQIMNESLITRARNELTRIFLREGFDYLMFIDADIGFDGEAVATLLEADRDVTCAIYPKKEVDWKQVARAADNGHREDLSDFAGAFVLNMVEAESTTDEHGLIEARHGGTGFMMIKRKVFEELEEHVPTYRASTVRDADGNYLMPEVKEYFSTSIDESGALLSEDFHFCELWRRHGGKVHLHPFIKLNHVGTYVYGGDILKSGGNLK